MRAIKQSSEFFTILSGYYCQYFDQRGLIIFDYD